jgi:hypothetical protein
MKKKIGDLLLVAALLTAGLFGNVHGASAQVLDGAALYAANCQSCHGSLANSDINNSLRTLAGIKGAGMSRGLTDAELTAIAAALAPSPPPPPQAGMAVWTDEWFKVTVKSKAYSIETLGLSDTQHKAAGYLNVTGWDELAQILDTTLYQYDEASGLWDSLSLPLHVVSGSSLNFQVSSQVTDGSNTYAFTAQIKGKVKNGILKSGTFKSLAGYLVQASPGDPAQSQAALLKITGKRVPLAKVPVP